MALSDCILPIGDSTFLCRFKYSKCAALENESTHFSYQKGSKPNLLSPHSLKPLIFQSITHKSTVVHYVIEYSSIYAFCRYKVIGLASGSV